MAQLGLSEKAVLSTVLFVPILISPNLNVDPINIIKLTFLTIFGFIAFSSSVGTFQQLLRVRINIVKVALLALILLGPLLFSGADRVSQFYGTFGRNTGFLAILSLVLIYFTVRFSVYRNFLESVLWTCLASALVTCSYGMLQYVGLDPLKWPRVYPGIFSTLGNPNFFGSHAALAFTVSFLLLVLKRKRKSKAQKNFLILMCCLTIFAVVGSKSLQGILLVGFTLIYASVSHLSLRGRIASKKIVAMSYFIFSLVSFGVVITFNYFYPSIFEENLNSLRVRFEYMRAGINMMLSNPVFGVGWDQYGDWYAKYRSASAYFGADFGEYADSAHNIWIDFGSFAGIPAFIFFLFFLMGTLRRTLKIASNSESNDFELNLVLVAAMHGFFLQTFISIGNLGLSTWGAVFSALVARDYCFEKSKQEVSRHKTKPDSPKLSRSRRIGVCLGSCLALVFAIPIFFKDASILDAQKSENVNKFTDKITDFPEIPFYYAYGVSILEVAGFNGKAAELAILGVKHFPHSRQLIQDSINLRALDSTSKEKFQLMLERLNPPRSRAQS